MSEDRPEGAVDVDAVFVRTLYEALRSMRAHGPGVAEPRSALDRFG